MQSSGIITMSFICIDINYIFFSNLTFHQYVYLLCTLNANVDVHVTMHFYICYIILSEINTV